MVSHNCPLLHDLSLKNLSAVFPEFNYHRAIKYYPNAVPKRETVWADRVPRLAKSSDGINLAFYLPNTFTPTWTVSFIPYVSHSAP